MEAQEGEDIYRYRFGIPISIYIVMTDLRCMAETNTTIKQLSSNLKSNNWKKFTWKTLLEVNKAVVMIKLISKITT